MLETPTRPPKRSPGRASPALAEDTVPNEFVARFSVPDGEFQGSLIELSAQLRAGKLSPIDVPLLTLTRAVLERYHALRAEVERDPSLLDAASEALPHLAGVIELKTRLLLPRPPVIVTEDGEPEGDATLESVLEGVEMLARLEGAIAFLRERRRERARMIVPGPHPLNLPRRHKPLSGSFGALVEAARRRVREVHLFDLALERLNLPQALERLREFARRTRRFFLRDVPAQDWGERTVIFAAMLEGVRAGELEASQNEPYADIEISRLET